MNHRAVVFVGPDASLEAEPYAATGHECPAARVNAVRAAAIGGT